MRKSTDTNRTSKNYSGSKTIRDDTELEKIKIIAFEEQQTILELKLKLLCLCN